MNQNIMKGYHIMFALAVLMAVPACQPSSDTNPEEPIMELFMNSYTIPANGGFIDVKLYTNQEYHFDIIDSWLTEIDVTSSDMLKIHKLKVEPNTEAEERTGTVTICTDQHCIPVTIRQNAADGSNQTGDDDEGGKDEEEDDDDSGFTSDDNGEWVTGQFVHRSLAIRTTADWCAFCPNMGAAFDYAKNIIPDSFEIIALHGSGTYMFSGTNAVFDPYPQNGYPTGVVDGRARMVNEEPSYLPGILAMNVAQETAANYPTVTGIALNSTMSGSNLEVSVSVYIKEAGSYKVTALVLEDGIVGYQNDHNGGVDDYEHNNVARIALSSGYGDSVATDSDNKVWTKSYSAAVSSAYKYDNLKVLVFVQKPYDSQDRVEKIYGVQYGICGDWYIDNCRAVKVGVNAPLELKNQE